MKGSSPCSLVASVFAASTAALASSSSINGDTSFIPCCCEGRHNSDRRVATKSTAAVGDVKDKFAPRFDGLRFIETLVTAHR